MHHHSVSNDVLNLKQIDADGKISLLQAAKVAKIERFIYFSLLNTEKIPICPLYLDLRQNMKNY